MSLDKVKKKKEKLECGLEGNIEVDWEVFLFYFNFNFLDKFVFKTWISGRVSYFIGILCGVENIFLLGCPQILSLLNLGSRVILNHIKV